MSLSRAVSKFLKALVGLKTRVDQLAKDVSDLRGRVDGFDAKRDAMAVPPGSTFFSDGELRLFRVTAPNGTTATAKLQTLNSSGNPIDDTVDTDDFTLYRRRPGVVAAMFEGSASDGTPRYVMLDSVFDARTTSSSGGSNQWTYQITERYKSSSGYGGWSDLSGGRSGTAYNHNEDQNAATGVQGNGVDQANLDTVNGSSGTHALKPIPDNTPVVVREVALWNGTSVTGVEYWIIQLPNGVDGVC